MTSSKAWKMAAPAMLAGLTVAPVFAQADGGFSREVVQPLPPQAAADLSSALKKLSGNAQDGDALLAAGWASLNLDNMDAATGFFTRALDLPSAAGEAKAGLGAVMVNRKRPVDALKLFDEAEALGAKLGAHAAERGLAYDLVGDNGRAQGFYREALAIGPSDEITKRLALSQAIAGDQNGSETTLLPLLQHRDLAAYRTRAFALAALGKTEEAVSIANAVMPATLASRIAPYLRYMPKLTKAQQAAAGNFGHFPDADAIGRDDTTIAAYASSAQALPPPAAALDARLTPSGTPLGETKPAAPPIGATIALAKAEELRPVVTRIPAPTPASTPTPAPVIAPTPVPTPAPTPAPVVAAVAKVEEPRPSFTLSPPQQPAAKPPPPQKLADAFADFNLAPGKATPAAGAVDITKIEPAREVVKKPEVEAKPTKAELKKAEEAKAAKAKPKKPVNPSRFWAQVGTGRNRSALAFDWKRFNKDEAKLFSGRKAYVAKWGATNRLVTGPFATQKEAAAFVSQLKKAGVDSFTFTSDEGEAVDALPGG